MFQIKKSTASTSSSEPSSRCINESPRALLENVVEYVMPTICNKVLDFLTGTEGRHKAFSEDVGKAVLMLMTENRREPIYDEILQTVRKCESVHRVCRETYLDHGMFSFERYLSQDDQIDYLMYLAIVCKLMSELSTTVAKHLIPRVIDRAKASMMAHAQRNLWYFAIDRKAKAFLKKRDSANEID